MNRSHRDRGRGLSILASIATKERPEAERLYDELNVRANTGLGAV
jgi:hypothetical protein